MLSQFYLLFLLALPTHSSLTPCSGNIQRFEEDTKVPTKYNLKARQKSIWSFREPFGGNLTFQFYSPVKISNEDCTNEKKNPPRIFVEISGEIIPFCQGRFVYYPLASSNAITVTLCDLDINPEIFVLITPKIAGNVFAKGTSTQKVIKPKKFIQWIRVRKNSYAEHSLKLKLQQITFRNSICSSSFITIQKISQDAQEETIQTICETSKVLPLQQFAFASSIDSVNITFQNVGFQLVYQTQHDKKDGKMVPDVNDEKIIIPDVDDDRTELKDDSSGFPIYVPFILGGVLLCVIVVGIFVVRRRRSKSKQESQAPTNLVLNSRVLQIGDGLHSINNMTYVSIESVNTRQPTLKVNSTSKRVDVICDQNDLTSIETTHQYDRDDYVGLESTRSKFQFHEVPFSRGALIGQSDRAPCPIPRAENINYSQVPDEKDDNQKNTPIGYSTVDDVLLLPRKPKDHSCLKPPNSLSASYDAVCDEASGKANVEYAIINKQNKKKPNMSSQPNLLMNNPKPSKPTRMRKASLDLLQQPTSYYMSPRPSDPDIQTFASDTRLNPNMNRVASDNRFISSTSNISLPTAYYDSPRPSVDVASINLQQNRVFSKHSVDL